MVQWTDEDLARLEETELEDIFDVESIGLYDRFERAGLRRMGQKTLGLYLGIQVMTINEI